MTVMVREFGVTGRYKSLATINKMQSKVRLIYCLGIPLYIYVSGTQRPWDPRTLNFLPWNLESDFFTAWSPYHFCLDPYSKCYRALEPRKNNPVALPF